MHGYFLARKFLVLAPPRLQGILDNTFLTALYLHFYSGRSIDQGPGPRSAKVTYTAIRSQ
jgi:hypothetical protein